MSEKRKEFCEVHSLAILAQRENFANKLRRQYKDSVFRQKREQFLEIYPISLSRAQPNSTELNYLKIRLEEIHEIISNPKNPLKDTILLPYVEEIRKILSYPDGTQTDLVVQLHFVPKLIEFLDIPLEEIRIQAAWGLANIAAGRTEYCAEICSFKGHIKLASLLMSSTQKMQEQCLWTLGNLAGDSKESINHVLETDIIANLKFLFQNKDTNISLLRVLAWTISNLCKTEQIIFREELFSFILEFLKFEDNEIIENSLWGLSNFTNTSIQNLKKIIDRIPLETVIRYINSNHTLQIPAIKVIGNLCSGTDEFVDCVCKTNVLPILCDLLKNNSNEAILLESCWIITNIASGTMNHVQLLLDLSIDKILMNIIETNTSPRVNNIN